jgi:AcrR family transcriptional regulator
MNFNPNLFIILLTERLVGRIFIILRLQNMTKQHILEIATQEFATYGYDGVSMNKLASKLDINKATIYYHFKDKKSLYHEVVSHLIMYKRESLEIIVNSDINPKEKLKQYIQLVINSVKKHPQIIQISLREMANFGVDIEGEQPEKDINEELNYLAQILKELHLKKSYKDIDPGIIKSLIFGTVNTYYSMQMSQLNLEYSIDFDNNSDKILDYINETITNLVIDGLTN